MVWPVSLLDIQAAERELEVTLPDEFRLPMATANGGSVELLGDSWSVCCVADSSSIKRFTRTFDGIVRQTRLMRELRWFPPEGVVIAICNTGRLVLVPESDARLSTDVFVWWLDGDAPLERVCSLETFFQKRMV